MLEKIPVTTMSKKVIITGASGFIGSSLTEKLKNKKSLSIIPTLIVMK